MTTDPRIQKMLDYSHAHAGQVVYSQNDPHRLSIDDAHMLSPTDCSGWVAKMFRRWGGVDIGTYTGNEQDEGKLITTSKADAAAGRGMLPGDLIFFGWDGNTIEHVAQYIGGGRIWNHGGPGKGPNNWSLSQSVGWAHRVMVRRITLPALPHPSPTPHPTPVPLIQTGSFLMLVYLTDPAAHGAVWLFTGAGYTHLGPTEYSALVGAKPSLPTHHASAAQHRALVAVAARLAK